MKRSPRPFRTADVILKNKQTCQSRRERERLKIIHFLGGKCQWPGCDWSDPRALQIDHIHGGGVAELRDLDGKWLSPDDRHRLVYKEPARFQLLCANHNWVKRAINKEARGAGEPRKPQPHREITLPLFTESA